MHTNQSLKTVPGSSRITIISAALCLMAISFLLYLPSLQNDFVWDAKTFIVDNRAIQDLDQLSTIFTQASTPQITQNNAPLEYLAYYRPLNKAFQILTYAAFQDQALGYKLTNMLLHSGVCLLAFLLFISITRNTPLSALAALLFTVKPTHVEAVAWTYSASYLLTAFFALAALLLYRHGPRWLALLGFTTALLFNEMGVLLLPILFLHRWLLEDARHPRDFLTLLPFVATVVGFLALRSSIVGAIPLSSVDLPTFINTSVVILQRYLKIFFWPDAPVTIYLAQSFTTVTAEVIASYLLALLLAVTALGLWFRDRVGLFWLLWFCCWISVSFNIGRFGDYLIAEKLIYIASIGPSMLLVSWLHRSTKGNIALVCTITLGAVLLHGVTTWKRLPYWKDTESYLQASLRFAPTFYNAHYNLANTYARQQNYALAQLHFEESLSLKPNAPLILSSLGNVHYFKQEYPQALAKWKEAIRQAPDYSQPYFYIGLVLQQQGDLSAARSYYQRYLSLEPNPPAEILQIIRSLPVSP